MRSFLVLTRRFGAAVLRVVRVRELKRWAGLVWRFLRRVLPQRNRVAPNLVALIRREGEYSRDASQGRHQRRPAQSDAAKALAADQQQPDERQVEAPFHQQVANRD